MEILGSSWQTFTQFSLNWCGSGMFSNDISFYELYRLVSSHTLSRGTINACRVSSTHRQSTDFQSCFFRKQTFVREKHGYFFSPPPSKMPFPRRLEIRETFDKWRISNHDRIRDFSLSLYFYSRHEKILVSLIMLRV